MTKRVESNPRCIHLTELILRVLADPLPATGVDAAYLSAPTADMVDSIVSGARRLVARGLAKRILFAGCEPISGYPGEKSFRRALIEGGVPADVLCPVDMQRLEIVHTRSESEMAIDFAMREGLSTLCVVSVPFHLPRAFVTMVTVARERSSETRIFSFPGDPQSWMEFAIHSQGVLYNTRSKLIAAEVERINAYHEKGDLESVTEILAYLNRRDDPSAERRVQSAEPGTQPRNPNLGPLK